MTASAHRGLFLDLDGTLACSLGVMRKVYQDFLKKHSRVATDTEFDSLNGPPLLEVIKSLANSHSLENTLQDLLAEYNCLIDDAYGEVLPSANAEDLLNAARKSGWLVGVVTSNNGKRAHNWLNNKGFGDLVDVLISGADVINGKPSPDPYLLALERTGCIASLSLAVEDSPQGAQSAVGAGLKTFGYEILSKNLPSWPNDVHRITDLRQLIPHLTGK